MPPRFVALLTGFLFLAGTAFAGPPEAATPGLAGTAAPPFQARDVQGVAVDSASLFRDGRVTLLNFWGLRCGACIEEMPHLNRLQEKYKGQVTILGVNVDGVEGEALAAQIAKLKLDIRYTVIPDPAFRLIDSYKMVVAPLNVVIDSKGVVRSWHENFEAGDEKKLDDLIARILAEKP